MRTRKYKKVICITGVNRNWKKDLKNRTKTRNRAPDYLKHKRHSRFRLQEGFRGPLIVKNIKRRWRKERRDSIINQTRNYHFHNNPQKYREDYNLVSLESGSYIDSRHSESMFRKKIIELNLDQTKKINFKPYKKHIITNLLNKCLSCKF